MSYHHNKREQEDEDEIVIAPMNVEGMPWYRKEEPWNRSDSKKKHDYSRKETFFIILGTLKAALLIAGAFLGAFALLILLICAFS